MRQDPKTMRTSPEGMAAIASSEGIVPAVYLDSVGVETFGIGVTHWAIGKKAMADLPRVVPSDVDAMVDHALDLFLKVLPKYEEPVRSAVRVPLHQHEFDALVHFTYNVGGPNFQKSKLLQNINAGRYESAGKSGFHGWLKPPELRGRRNRESDIFLKADYGTSPIPVYGTNGRMRLGGRIKVIPRAQILAMIRDTGGTQRAAPVVEQPRPAPRIPPEVIDLIEETDGHHSKTGMLNGLMQQLSGAGVSAAAVLAFVQDIDPIIAAALIAAGALVFVVAMYTKASRTKKALASEAARSAILRTLDG